MPSSDTYLCPRCRLPLKTTKTQHGIFWGCDNCGGRAVTVELLRRTFTPASINPLWIHAIRGEGPSSVGCPSCQRPMIQVALSEPGGVNVDVCKLCHFVWFDAHEVDGMVPHRGLDPLHPPREERERVMAEKIKSFSEKVDRYHLTTTSSSEIWRTLANILFPPPW